MLHKKLKLLKPCLRARNRDKYGDITKQTKEAYDLLCLPHEHALPTQNLATFEAEAQTMAQWNHFAEVDKSFFKQKSLIA